MEDKDALRQMVRDLIKEAYFHPLDDLLAGITFQDLIVAVESNEKVVNEQSVRKVFKEMLKANVKDAEYELKQNMKRIIGEAGGK